MKAIEIRETFGLDNLVIADRPDPVPGPREVAVRVRAASLNYRDLMMIRGEYNPRQKLPLVPLSDGVGQVVALGAGASRAKIGDRVAGLFAQGFLAREMLRDPSALRRTLGGPLDGMLAETVVLPEDSIVQVPKHLTDVEAATLPCAALTAWSAIVSQSSVAPGDTIVVQGTGGVSIFALQIGRMMGARVLVTSKSDEKLERAKALGAGGIINYKAKPDWSKEVRAMTDGRGADLVIDVGGSSTLSQSIRAVRPGGQVNVIGILSGGQGEVSMIPVLMQNLRLQGVFVGSRTEFEAMNQAFGQHELRPIVDRVFPFTETRAALEHLARGDHFGKVCIDLQAR